MQVAAGVVGASPSLPGAPLQLSVNAQGRLQTEEQFGDIVLKTSPDGGVTHLRDVARVELGASEYGLRALLDNKPAVAIAINQSPGANSLAISEQVRKTMSELKADMPPGVEYRIVYDPTQFVRASINAVVHTLLEAIALVVIVVIVFLQTWRASIIPLIAVPVSIVGTFSLLLAFGFSINALSLFGMVLAIGIVVDDAIVVVENVERNIASGLSAKEATYRAMREVSGPIIAIALTLVAVFVPLAFMSGLTGQFYKQFAMTIAISTVISAFNSLTLSPALSALLLKAHDEPQDWLTWAMNRVLGGFFRRFNKVFHRGAEHYGHGVRGVIGRKASMMAVYAVLLGATVFITRIVPGGFVPAQDKEYLIAFAQLPNGASLDRTEQVIREMSDVALKQPGVESAVAFPGLSVNGFTNSSSAGIVFVTLKPFSERHGAALSAGAIAGALNQKYASVKGSFIAVFPPPPVLGLGTLGGIQNAARGPRRARLHRVEHRDAGIHQARGEHAGIRADVLQLPDQCTAAQRRSRPGQGQAARRVSHRRIQHDAGVSRLAVRERLQSFWSRLPGLGTGRCAIPGACRRHWRTEDAQRQRRHGAPVVAGDCLADLRSRDGGAL